MYNLLLINEKCPRCGEVINTEAEFKMGRMNMHTYILGDILTRATGQCKLPHQKRAVDGNAKGEGYVCCPKCN